jgi:hypothetical protein
LRVLRAEIQDQYALRMNVRRRHGGVERAHGNPLRTCGNWAPPW